MRVVLFDWNGTLLNDTPLWHASVQETFRSFGSEAPTIAEYFRELKGDYLDIYRSRGITATREELNVIYESAYEARINTAQLEPGARETLIALLDKKVKMGLVTMQPEGLVTPLLRKLGVSDYFTECLYHIMKKNEAILAFGKRHGVASNDCFFVGDTPSDIRHANLAGVVSVAYHTEHIPYELFVGEAKPIYTINHLRELIILTR